MMNFDYVRAASVEDAAARASLPGASLIAGGTTLIDLAKCDVARPQMVVDITGLPGLSDINAEDGRVTIGALATMSRVAADPVIAAEFPAIAEALLLSASAQLRNMATIGGNLLQRTRCTYFRDPAAYPACNKRNPGSGCAALGGHAREHAVLGASESCIALYPGDLAVALVALDATVHTSRRDIPIGDVFLQPGATPERETVLEGGEVILSVSVPRTPDLRSAYIKVRDRQSYEFAAASAAAAVSLDADNRTIRTVRAALGGVATVPWRAPAVEAALVGQPFDEASVRAASRAAMEGALAHGGNEYKIELGRRVLARAILAAGGIR
ncbi:FAD binding domain-containing protein [Acuticoccus kandeliae]|uniref:FAD binding domain-containing protein n=1 Tax=Acuticoccus kandeliae TaxID=2073160 RepID=UPI000D3EA4E5|nr:xanthine dehydrogenase family protein subunit M [Acuticoccus kandeliae]